jgi:hypothetical protein
METQHFQVAPWSRALRISSALGTVLLAGIEVGAFRGIPPYGVAHAVGTAVACVPPAILLFSLLFVVTGYTVTREELRVRRLLFCTVFPLHGLRQARHEPKVLCGSTRIFGNAGLFSFTGLYQSKPLGRYRLFATDPSRAVVLVLPGRTLVLTPASPQAFLLRLRQLFPNTAGIHKELHGA